MAFENLIGTPTDNDLRKHGLFCDALIVTAEGRMFPVHKNIVLIAAPASAHLFKNEHEITLSSVDGDILELLLEYIYTGRLPLPIDEQTANKLKDVALLFGLSFKGNAFSINKSCNERAFELDAGEPLPLHDLAVRVTIDPHHQIEQIDGRLLALIDQYRLTGEVTLDLEDIEMVDLFENKFEKTAALFGLSCDKNSPVPSIQNDYIKKSTDDKTKSFECSYCLKKYASAVSLGHHVTTRHSKSRNFVCSDCGQTFAFKSHFERHVLSHVSENLPFFCQFCPKKFRTKLQKQVHERIHTGENPYGCRFCQKSFKQITHKKAHERTHVESEKLVEREFDLNNDPKAAPAHSIKLNSKKQLWQFLLLTLLDISKRDIMAWQGNEGSFTISNPQALAQLWAKENNSKSASSINNLTRSLTNYFIDGILAKGKEKNEYRFACDVEALLGMPLKKLLEAKKVEDVQYKAVVDILKYAKCRKRGVATI